MEQQSIFKKTLNKDDFYRLSQLIHTRSGIKMPKAKKLMLEGRLRKRLRALGMDCYEKYCDYLFSEEGIKNEMIHMIDVVTTNKTEFFREPGHFDYLAQKVIAELVGQEGEGGHKRLSVWSAGCSTGEEPYTIAMVIDSITRQHMYADFDYRILATDLSTKVLEAARMGIYRQHKIESIPEYYKKVYIRRGTGGQKGLVRIIPELRCRVSYHRLNLISDDFGIDHTMDMVFCRNVIIYFDRPTQERLLHNLLRHLKKGGYLFLGHAETLSYLNISLKQVAPSIYRKL